MMVWRRFEKSKNIMNTFKIIPLSKSFVQK
jgi:hypothetical protein